MSRYKIWNKTDNIITPIGEILTPEQWIKRYPAAAHIDFVIADGEINGAFCSPLSQMVEVYANNGVNFTGLTTPNEKLAAIEAFEDEMNSQQPGPTPEERIAASLELQNLMAMPDAE